MVVFRFLIDIIYISDYTISQDASRKRLFSLKGRFSWENHIRRQEISPEVKIDNSSIVDVLIKESIKREILEEEQAA